jgi:hypothetical protein
MAYLPSMESGGLEHLHDTPPHPFMPSPTFKYSSRGQGQRTEDRGQRTEDRGQRTEDRGHRGQRQDRGQRTEDRGQRNREDRGQRTEDGGQSYCQMLVTEGIKRQQLELAM